ncbi:Gfo/Idh/MocA family oxidoreductase [Ensifer adhaerens]|uniref:Gfo/Idh/MocA family protein n=1 Tax=Ensifer adhaerens TaxID=106592 RepID=UPI0023A99608|nr:Gfo/Idh/MocA family oxidoreductase [Ensifer adhaerens]WDZ75599.1 Gfo/Idh/MocA family oxidoreductase [Ensifer adhaerens]
MRDRVRWGVAGTGTIANNFASDFRFAGNATLAAVSSRSAEKAQAFAARHGGIRSYHDIQALADAADIDAIYIASPNAMHRDHAGLALAAGKAVLVEKPLTTSVTDARALEEAAAAGSTFAMEALWTCFLPAIANVRTLLRNQKLGTVRHVRAELAYEKPFDPGSRFFDPALGGGSLLDLGIYPIALCLNLFGRPKSIDGTWRSAPTGVDVSADIRLAYAGFDAELSCGFDRDGHNRFVIEGDRGTLVVDAPFLKASRLFGATSAPARKLLASTGQTLFKVARRLRLPGLDRFDHAFPGNGLQFEIEAASAAILEGRREHALMPLSHSIEALEIIETIRAKAPAS